MTRWEATGMRCIEGIDSGPVGRNMGREATLLTMFASEQKIDEEEHANCVLLASFYSCLNQDVFSCQRERRERKIKSKHPETMLVNQQRAQRKISSKALCYTEPEQDTSGKCSTEVAQDKGQQRYIHLTVIIPGSGLAA